MLEVPVMPILFTRSAQTSAPRWMAAGESTRRPVRVPADEAEHLGLRVGVVLHRYPGAVLPGRPHDLLDRLHPGQQLDTEVGVEAVVLAGGAGEVPGVHEHIGGVE